MRWGLKPLTARDKAAPDLGDVLKLATPRTDDPLSGVQIPMSSVTHPNQAQPSTLEKIHAHRVSLLPLRSDKGSCDKHVPPDLSTSASVGDYIQARTAAWSHHLERRKQGRAASTNG